MAKKEKVTLPGTGGLFRIYEEEGKGIKLKPEHVLVMCVLVILFEVLLHFYGNALY